MLASPKKLTQRPASKFTLLRIRRLLADNPDVTWMPLSEILHGVVLKGALYFNAEFSAPWGFRTPATAELAQLLTPGAPHLLIYHFWLGARGIARLEGDLEIALTAGDVIVVTHGDPHEMCSAVNAPP